MADGIRTTDLRTIIPDEYDRLKYRFRNTFSEQVANAWELTWFGQLMTELNDDDSYLQYPEDPDLDVYSYLENTHYMKYQDHFKDMRNADHIQHVKNKIDRNNHLRELRDDGGIIPDLVAQLGDPLTYVPIPFVKGLTLGSRFLKTGAATSALVASAEPARQYLDPTATIGESAQYIGGAFVLGGLGGVAYGLLGGQTRGGRTLIPKSKPPDDLPIDKTELDMPSPQPKYFGPVSEKTETEAIDDLMGSFWDKEHKIFKSDVYNANTDVFYRPVTETVAGRLGYKLDTAKLSGTDDFGNPLFVKIVDAKDGRNNYINDTIKVDDEKIFRAWKNQTYISNTRGQHPLPRFASDEDFKKFLIEKAHIKHRGLQPKGETIADVENAINKEVLEKIRLDTEASRRIPGKVLPKVAKLLTDQDRLTNNNFKNKAFSDFVADTAEELSGDYSLVTIGNRQGRVTEHSAHNRAQLNTIRDTARLRRVLNNNYASLVEGISEAKRFLGYDATRAGITMSRLAEPAINKIKGLVGAKVENIQKKISFQEYNEMIGMAARDENYRALQPDAIKKGADELRQLLDEVGMNTVKENLMYSQKSISGKRKEWLNLLEEAKTAKENATDPNLKKVFQEQIDEAQAEINMYDDELDELLLDPERAKDFLQPNYFPREISRKKVLESNAKYDNDFEMPDKIEKVQVVGGLYPGMVIKFRGNATNEPIDIGSIVQAKDRNNFGKVKKIEGDKITVEFVNKKTNTSKSKPFKKSELLHVKEEGVPNNVAYGNLVKVNKNGSVVVEYPTGINSELTTITIPKNLYGLKSPKQFNQEMKYYGKPNPAGFRGIVFNAIVREPKKFEFKDVSGNVQQVFESTDNFNVNIRTNNAIQSITRDAKIKDIENSIGYEKTDDGYTPYTSHYMTRKLPVEDSEIMDYLNHDTNYMIRNYIEVSNKRIEISKKFGDPYMKQHLWKTRQKAYTEEYTSTADVKPIETALNRLRAQRDKMYGIYNTMDPDDLFKSRVPAGLRNWASTTMMGAVTITSQVDWARIPMVHGFSNWIKSIDATTSFFNPKVKSFLDGEREIVKRASFIYEAAEITMNNTAAARVLAQNEKISTKDDLMGRFFFQPFEKLQAPFYHVNGLSLHTNMVKDQTGFLSAHRFIEDAIKVSKGTASDFEKSRLAGYGISPADARGLAKLDFDRNYDKANGLILFDEKKWHTSLGKNSDYLLDKLRIAVYSDVQRTIITPSVADKPNMMYGVVPINTESMTPFLLGMSPGFVQRNPGIRKTMEYFLGFEKLPFGAKLNNGWFGSPLQFFAWSFAANRKLILAGLSDRDLNFAAGVVAMIGFGYLVDRAKNPTYHQHKTLEEKIYRAIEISGVLGLPGDLNFILEVMSEGLTDDMIGIRKVLGTPGRFGAANEADAIGEIVGPGLGMPIDLFHAFNEDLAYDEKARVIRRLIPFNNLILLRGLFRDLYDLGAEALK